jgi:hypothetical protein
VRRITVKKYKPKPTRKDLKAKLDILIAAVKEIKEECTQNIDCNHQDADDGSDDCTDPDDCIRCTIMNICKNALREIK